MKLLLILLMLISINANAHNKTAECSNNANIQFDMETITLLLFEINYKLSIMSSGQGIPPSETQMPQQMQKIIANLQPSTFKSQR